MEWKEMRVENGILGLLLRAVALAGTSFLGGVFLIDTLADTDIYINYGL